MAALGRIFGREGRDPPPPPAVAEILVVGEEILRGIVIDANGAWLASELAGVGLLTGRMCVLPDDVESISREVAAALVRGASLIVTTGGLGPTADDLTLKAVALACGVPLQRDADALEWVETRYRSLAAAGHVSSAAMTPEREKMAHLPFGAAMVPNLVGSAPGAILEARGTLVACLPGVPAELHPMWGGPVKEVVSMKLGTGSRATETVATGGNDESVLGPLVALVASRHPLAYLKTRPAGFGAEGGIAVTVDVVAPDVEAAGAALGAVLDDLRRTLDEAGIDTTGR